MISQCNILKKKTPAQITFYNTIITFKEALLNENCTASTPRPNDIQTVWLWAPTAAKTIEANNINSTWI